MHVEGFNDLKHHILCRIAKLGAPTTYGLVLVYLLWVFIRKRKILLSRLQWFHGGSHKKPSSVQYCTLVMGTAQACSIFYCTLLQVEARRCSAICLVPFMLTSTAVEIRQVLLQGRISCNFMTPMTHIKEWTQPELCQTFQKAPSHQYYSEADEEYDVVFCTGSRFEGVVVAS